MNYVNLLQVVTQRIAKVNGDDDMQNYYERIVEEFELAPGSTQRERAEYYAERIHKEAGFNVLFDIVFGDNPYTSNDGYYGIQEWAIESHQGYIQNQSELGFSRVTMFDRTMEEEPEWLTNMVAESELDYYHQIMPEFLDEDDRKYMKHLEEILNE